MSQPEGGVFCQELERWLSEELDYQNPTLVSSATAGLYLALRAAGVGFGDRVMVPAYTMAAAAEAVEMCGAEPWLVDVSVDHGMMTLETIAEAHEECRDEWNRPPQAIIPTPICGHTYPVGLLAESLPHLKVVTDAAQAFGCFEKPEVLYGKSGAATVFSFKQGKLPSCGEGGLVVTPDAGVRRVVRAMRNHGDVTDSAIDGFNFHMTEMQAAVLLGKLQTSDFLETFDKRLRFSKMLAALVPEPYIAPRVFNAPFLFGVRAPDVGLPGPRGWQRGYHKPLCCLPKWGKQGHQVNAHIYYATTFWTKPPESEEDVAKLANAFA